MVGDPQPAPEEMVDQVRHPPLVDCELELLPFMGIGLEFGRHHLPQMWAGEDAIDLVVEGFGIRGLAATGPLQHGLELRECCLGLGQVLAQTGQLATGHWPGWGYGFVPPAAAGAGSSADRRCSGSR
jgi:hypothetical protein